ncbi:hypothetical protein MHA_2725 [Mannheimia haemolytica PHL213]|nr:hypothetical protein MHA_2725 [Mannheimia haemolytica PHL213]
MVFPLILVGAKYFSPRIIYLQNRDEIEPLVFIH